ncbi:MAG: DUF4132 domain-containing protein [Myxococcota bacterium]
MSWPTDLREEWARMAPPHGQSKLLEVTKGSDDGWRRELEVEFREEPYSGRFLAHAPREVGREYLPRWGPPKRETTLPRLLQIVAVHELDALPVALRHAKQSPAEGTVALLAFDSPDVAPFMADAFARLKTLRRPSRQWLLHHPKTAAFGLLPAALGKKGRARTAARAALHLLVLEGQRAALEEAGAAYGDAAAPGLQEILDYDPLQDFPSRMPKLPEFVDSESLPRILARGGSELSTEATEHLIVMLAMSKLDAPYAGVRVAAEALDAKSLGTFSWALFSAWVDAGASNHHNWAFTQLGLLGGDECVRKLVPKLKSWPADGGHHRAVLGLDVLTAIGTDVALMHLHAMSEKLKFKGLKRSAAAKVQEIADERGLTPAELGDRLVPSLGLDANGSLRLDFGPRFFTVGFDEQLRPFVLDEQRRLRKTLPKPGVKDDPEKGAAASDAFRALKKDVRALAKHQIARLELAMCDKRLWAPSDFQALLVDHPLMIHLVRRLVFATYAGAELRASFRVAEDRAFSGVDEEDFTLDPSLKVGIVHPLDLGCETTTRWATVFSDYELLQPFEQLGRPVFEATSEELQGTALARHVGTVVSTNRVVGLERRGWVRGEPEDAGMSTWFERPLLDGRCVILEIDPGIAAGAPSEFLQQELGLAYVARRAWSSDRQPLSTIDRVSMSELLRDLASLVA